MALQDHVGKKYGIWTLIGPVEGRHPFWLAQCDCGAARIARLQSIQLAAHALTRRCQCSRVGQTREYRTYLAMHQRCENPNASGFQHYGGRGIVVCQRWSGFDGFKNFIADMGFRPSREHSLDRIDVDGNYEPGNVRWATVKVQANNRRNSKWREAVSL